MTGESFWLEPALMVLGAFGVVLLVWLASRASGFLLDEPRQFECPVRHQHVHCKLVEDVRTGEWKEVKRCSAWPILGGRCEKKCLQCLNEGTVAAV